VCTFSTQVSPTKALCAAWNEVHNHFNGRIKRDLPFPSRQNPVRRLRHIPGTPPDKLCEFRLSNLNKNSLRPAGHKMQGGTFHLRSSVLNIGEDVVQETRQQRNVFGHQFGHHRLANRLNQNPLFREILGDARLIDICLSSLFHSFLDPLNPVAFHVTGRDEDRLEGAQTEIVMRLVRQLLVAQSATQERVSFFSDVFPNGTHLKNGTILQASFSAVRKP
jgi:hypothetical protein